MGKDEKLSEYEYSKVPTQQIVAGKFTKLSNKVNDSNSLLLYFSLF